MLDRELDELRRTLKSLAAHGRRPYFSPESIGEAWQPNIDVYETRDSLVVLVELAGARGENVRVDVRDGVLRIRGIRDAPFRAEYTQFHRLEIAQGAFERALRLPRPVDEARAEATFRAGFLEVVLPFARPKRVTVTRPTESLE